MEFDFCDRWSTSTMLWLGLKTYLWCLSKNVKLRVNGLFPSKTLNSKSFRNFKRGSVWTSDFDRTLIYSKNLNVSMVFNWKFIYIFILSKKLQLRKNLCPFSIHMKKIRKYFDRSWEKRKFWRSSRIFFLNVLEFRNYSKFVKEQNSTYTSIWDKKFGGQKSSCLIFRHLFQGLK